jgi:hypothetical protein
MTWQPIETAPQDGTDILVWDGEVCATCYWSEHGWSLTVTYGDEDDVVFPTHWQPLPAPPGDADHA